MKQITYILTTVLSILIITSCSKKDGCTDPLATNHNPDADKNDGSCTYNTPDESGTFKLNFIAKSSEGQTLVMNQPYSDSANYTIQIEGFKFYISNIRLVRPNNSELKIKDVDLINFNSSNENSSSISVPKGDYKAIKFGIGVDSILNNTDPTKYPTNHPLSVFQNTYWNWSTQYRFVMLEGKADTVNGSSSNINQLLIYHTGTDALYREFSKNINFSIQKDAVHQENLTIDINKIFYTTASSIDLKTESATHTVPNFALALKVTDNFLSAIE